MTRYHGKDGRIQIDHYDLSGLANSWTLNTNRDVAEVTAFADTAKEFVVGDYGCDVAWTSFFDTGTAGWDETEFGYIVSTNQDRYVGLFPYGYTAGSVAYELPEAIVNTDSRAAPVADAITLDGSAQGESLGRGQVLWTGAISATGTTAVIDYGAKAAGATMMVVYRLSALDGAGDMVFAVEESSAVDGGGDAFAAIAALASGTLTANGTTVKTTTGATERYLRLNTTTFAPTSVTALVTITTLG